jgi:hypothetical protein
VHAYRLQVLSKEYYSKTKWTSKDKLGKWNGGSKKKIVDAATIGSLEKTEKNKKLKLKGTRKEEDEVSVNQRPNIHKMLNVIILDSRDEFHQFC